MISILTVKGDLLSRYEVFDEADLDAALARFDELQAQAPRLENAATQMEQRFNACFAARDWAAMAEVLSDDLLVDDRRRVVNAGVRRGRDAEIASERAVADVGVTNYRRTVIAIRGGRLALSGYSISDGWSGTKVLCVSEINAENQIGARVVFDADDIDAAFAELDARYLAGEAAVHAHTWSVIARECVRFNRRELPAADWVTVDHRPMITIDTSDLLANIRATWDLMPDISIRIEAVHRLSSFGAVVTYAAYGTSPEGLAAEWRMIQLLTVDGDRIDRCEIFDETDLDAARARFDELTRQGRRLKNTATRVQECVFSFIASGDWHAVAQTTAENVSVDDRRRVVNAGVLHGRNANIASTHATVDVGFTMKMVGAIATRGEHLALIRVRVSGPDPETIQNDALSIVEIDADERIARNVVFDLNDFEAAMAELDARYVAGEAAAHANTWSVIAGATSGFNRHELPPTTRDPVYIDHRPLMSIEGVDLAASLRAVWDITADVSVYIEAVHRLNELGCVITQVLKMTSQEGFDAEVRMIQLQTTDGDLISRFEVFDEADLDAALARFDELDRPSPTGDAT
jgi:hypothetical protein